MAHRRPDEIVVVAGIPRSGTSLLMQMLAVGGVPPLCDDVRPPDEHNPRGYYELAAAKRLASDSRFLACAVGRAVKIVHALVPRLPREHRYRVLLVERRMDEVLASQQRMLSRVGTASDADDRLGAVFAAQLEQARRWLDGQPCADWLPVRHAELIAHPAECAERIDAFLGGGLDRRAMAAAVDPALHRVRAEDPCRA